MMTKFLWSSAALLTLLVTVESLTCKTCEVGILGSCIISTSQNCTKAEDRCFSAVAKFTADFEEIHQRGCTTKNKCNNSTGSILSINYTITKSCCSTDLCNGAAPIQLPFTAALSAALVVIWSQWGL